MADEHHELIIIRRHEEDEHEQHSSAWKVAHADFMTAMMAFFLIMWLINVTDDQMRKGISEYFNPIHMSAGDSAQKGLNKPDANAEKDGKKSAQTDSKPMIFNPVNLSPGRSDAKKLTVEEATAAAEAAAQSAGEAAKALAAAAARAGKGAGETDKGSGPTPDAGAVIAVLLASGPNSPGGKAAEEAAFQDPYAVLTKLAEKYDAEHPGTVAPVAGDERKQGLPGGAAERDPFDPVYWQLTDTPPAVSDDPGDPGTAPTAPDAMPDAAAAATHPLLEPGPESAGIAEKLDGTPVMVPASVKVARNPAPAPVPAPPVANATPPVAETAPPPAASVPAPGKADAGKQTAAELNHEIASSVKDTMGKDAAPFLSVEATAEGVLIALTDDADFSMFEVGSAIPNDKVVVLMARVAKALAAHPGNVIIRGYTDGRPFRSDVYDNWRLSAARAQMAHYMLQRGGLDDTRVTRIEGYADRLLKVAGNPLAAENRRIEILLQEKKP